MKYFRPCLCLFLTGTLGLSAALTPPSSDWRDYTASQHPDLATMRWMGSGEDFWPWIWWYPQLKWIYLDHQGTSASDPYRFWAGLLHHDLLYAYTSPEVTLPGGLLPGAKFRLARDPAATDRFLDLGVYHWRDAFIEVAINDVVVRRRQIEAWEPAYFHLDLYYFDAGIIPPASDGQLRIVVRQTTTEDLDPTDGIPDSGDTLPLHSIPLVALDHRDTHLPAYRAHEKDALVEAYEDTLAEGGRWGSNSHLFAPNEGFLSLDGVHRNRYPTGHYTPYTVFDYIDELARNSEAMDAGSFRPWGYPSLAQYPAPGSDPRDSVEPINLYAQDQFYEQMLERGIPAVGTVVPPTFHPSVTYTDNGQTVSLPVLDETTVRTHYATDWPTGTNFLIDNPTRLADTGEWVRYEVGLIFNGQNQLLDGQTTFYFYAPDGTAYFGNGPVISPTDPTRMRIWLFEGADTIPALDTTAYHTAYLQPWDAERILTRLSNQGYSFFAHDEALRIPLFFVRRYQHSVPAWEFGNEPDITPLFWDASGDTMRAEARADFFAWLDALLTDPATATQHVSAGAFADVSSLITVYGAPGGAFPTLLDGLEARALDALSFHHYWRADRQNYLNFLSRLQNEALYLLDYTTRPLVLSEIGYLDYGTLDGIAAQPYLIRDVDDLVVDAPTYGVHHAQLYVGNGENWMIYFEPWSGWHASAPYQLTNDGIDIVSQPNQPFLDQFLDAQD
ncbi:MAG: hypothetical protein Q7P63_09285 [Verrucomicrobiota bacterium JB022]|nr:hypothetical protein [Verrucomicrobiota bacterium JB022]